MIIFLEKGGPFGWLLERLSGRDELDEMAGLKKPDSGLPVNLWLDDSHAYVHGGHSKRIKFQGDYGNNTNRDNLFPMSISKEEPRIPDKLLPKIKLPSRDIEAIKTFVKNNADLLSKLADEKITFANFICQMKT